jgi:hypothetical protein
MAGAMLGFIFNPDLFVEGEGPVEGCFNMIARIILRSFFFLVTVVLAIIGLIVGHTTGNTVVQIIGYAMSGYAAAKLILFFIWVLRSSSED